MGRKRSLSHTSDNTDEAAINLTPLIDVVFVVLIMFIIVAPMLEVDRVQLANSAYRENKEASSVQEASAISIRVHEDNTIWYNSKCVKIEELHTLLTEAKRVNPKKVPQLFHDKKAHFGTYQNVKNAVEQSGFEQMDVILLPSSSKT